MVLRSDIERALDDLTSNEEGMRFQGLAVVLAKKRWPDLIACERKKGLGADAIAKAPFAAEGEGKALACSITPTIGKIRGDAEKIRNYYPNISKLIFATPAPVTNTIIEQWMATIQAEFGYDLGIMPREDFITSLLDPSNASLLASHLGLTVEVEPKLADVVSHVRAAAAEVTAVWSKRVAGKPLILLRARRLDREGKDTDDILQLGDLNTALRQSGRLVLEGPAGRGKTTTLIQLAKLHEDVGRTPLLVELPYWVSSKIGMLQYIADMPQFKSRSIDAVKLAQVAKVEPFSFLLNGWNEIGAQDFANAESALRTLERDFPEAGILVATRTHHLVPRLAACLASISAAREWSTLKVGCGSARGLIAICAESHFRSENPTRR